MCYQLLPRSLVRERERSTCQRVDALLSPGQAASCPVKGVKLSFHSCFPRNTWQPCPRGTQIDGLYDLFWSDNLTDSSTEKGQRYNPQEKKRVLHIFWADCIRAARNSRNLLDLTFFRRTFSFFFAVVGHRHSFNSRVRSTITVKLN